MEKRQNNNRQIFINWTKIFLKIDVYMSFRMFYVIQWYINSLFRSLNNGKTGDVHETLTMISEFKNVAFKYNLNYKWYEI